MANWFVITNGTGTSSVTSGTQTWATTSAWSIATLNANWSKVAAGDTVWVAGGNYTTSMSFTKSGTSGNPITVSTVLTTDAVASVTGFLPAYAVTATKATITAAEPFDFSTAVSWINVTGRIGTQIVPGTFGFVAIQSNQGDLWAGGVSISVTGCSNLSFSFIEMYFHNSPPNTNGGTSVSWTANPSAFAANAGNNVTVSNCNIHGAVECIKLDFGCTNYIFDHCDIWDSAGNSSFHPNMCELNGSPGPLIFRYCTFHDWEIEGMEISNGVNFLQIYGCSIYNNSGSSSFLWPSGTGESVGPQLLLYNNSFFNSIVTNGQGNTVAWGSGSQALNNIYVSTSWSGATVTGSNFDYGVLPISEANGISTATNPYTNPSAFNFQPSATASPSVSQGVTLASPYNIDPNGVTRVPGNWTRGAYQLGGTTLDTVAPGVPTALNSPSQTTTTINLAWTPPADGAAGQAPSASVQYNVAHKGGAIGTTFTQFVTTTSATSIVDTGLTSGTTYTYEVQSSDPNSSPVLTSAQTAPFSVATQAPDTSTPTAPTALTVGTITSNSIALSWTAATDINVASSLLVYTIQDKTTGSFVTVGTTTGVTSFTVTGLNPSTTYSFQVTATNPNNGNIGPPDPNPPTLISGTTTTAPVIPVFVQTANSGATVTGTTATATYAAQTAGDLNVLVVGFGSTTATVTTTVSTIVDSHGQTYTLAHAFQFFASGGGGGSLGEAIYYSNNIAGGANTVTVTLSGSSSFFAIQVFEYAGIADVSPVDVTAGATATTGTAISSGAATTNFSNDLIFGAMGSWDGVTSAGTSFNPRSTVGGGVYFSEDEIGTTAGSFSATATDGGTNGWVSQMVAFKANAVVTGQTVTVVGVPSAQAIGIVGVAATGTATVTVAGVPSSQAFGVLSVNAPATVTIHGVVTSESLSALSVAATGTSTISVHGVPTSEAFSPLVVVDNSTVLIHGVPTGESFSPLNVDAPAFVFYAGPNSSEDFSPLVVSASGAVNVFIAGVPSAESFSALSITEGSLLFVFGVPTQEHLSPIAVTSNYTITIVGVPTSELFSADNIGVAANQLVNLAGVVTAEAFSHLAVTAGNVTIVIAGVASSELLSPDTIRGSGSTTLLIVGVATSEKFAFGPYDGTIPYNSMFPYQYGLVIFPSSSLFITVIGIPSGESIGELHVMFPGGPTTMSRNL